MSVLRLRLGRACLSAATGRVYFYDRAHPRMNAALKAAGADWQIGTSRRWTSFCCARRNENDRSKVEAFRRWDRITGNTVEVRNKPAAKLGYLGERVNFAASIFNLRRTANVQVRLARLVAPLVGVLCCCEFRDELVESCITVANARTVTQYRVKANGFAIVVHAELLIALHSAGAGSETQQSNSCESRPDYGAETKLSLHWIILLDCAGSLISGQRADSL